MNNSVLVLSHNCLEKTKACIKSIAAQDIPTYTMVVDNRSTDGTVEWLTGVTSEDFNGMALLLTENRGVSYGWNYGLNCFFGNPNVDHVLVCNNDTVLPSWFYSTLLSYEGPFITGISVGSMDEIAFPPPRKELVPSPDMSAFLIRRTCWDKVGEFDADLVHYCGDLDYHLRAHRAGVRLMNCGCPFYHERSSTINQAAAPDRREIQAQADADRAEFTRKWGVSAGGPDYVALLGENTFGIEKHIESMRENNTL